MTLQMVAFPIVNSSVKKFLGEKGNKMNQMPPQSPALDPLLSLTTNISIRGPKNN